ncbi:MAG: ABC transporter permease [Mangrovibacterium sp.]
MNKALLILQREYLTRVKKKSFIITTLLVPITFAALIGFSVWMSMKGGQEKQHVAVYDETGLFLNRLEKTELLSFTYIPRNEYLQFRSDNATKDYDALLYIPYNLIANNHVQIFSNNQVPKSTQSNIRRQISDFITNDKRANIFKESGIPDLEQKLTATTTRIHLDTIKLNDDGTSSSVSTEVNTIVGYLGGFLIYMMIFMYGAMVMRGVTEEKTNRISEILVSSVKPMQLMFGKIIGIGLVGLTQFVIWVIFMSSLFTLASNILLSNSTETLVASQNIIAATGVAQNSPEIIPNDSFIEVNNIISSLNIPFIVGSFLIFFILGYLLYASIMGAIGSAVSSDEDAQQLVSLVAFPLIIAIMMITPVGENPNGSLAFWSSMFPLLSPVCMMVRIPAGIAVWEVILSIVLLLLTTLACVWAAAKIYRTGILMYGKKVNIREIIKWIGY